MVLIHRRTAFLGIAERKSKSLGNVGVHTMTTFDLVFLTFLAALSVLLVVYMLRNSVTCNVRMKFALKNFTPYERLPSYDAMLLNPKYLHMWTYGQWLRKLERES